MDKKTAAVVFVTVLFFGAITAGAVFLFLKPSREEAVTTAAASAFPVARPGARPAASAPPPQAIPAPSDWNRKPAARPPVRGRVPGKSGGGSLGFIKKDDSFVAGTESKPELSEAAKNGDAKAFVEGLRRTRGEETGALSDTAIRAVMQKVVDSVKTRQPRWYKQFLANRNLKAIADRYDKDNDFDAFVRLLSKSTPFKSMLKLKSRKPELKELTWSILSDQGIGPSLKQLLLQKRDDAHLMGLLGNYGQDAGIPSEMLEEAGVRVKQSKPKRRASRRRRPQLRKRGFGGYEDKAGAPSDSDGGAQALPAGVTPAMVEKYKKYMKK